MYSLGVCTNYLEPIDDWKRFQQSVRAIKMVGFEGFCVGGPEDFVSANLQNFKTVIDSERLDIFQIHPLWPDLGSFEPQERRKAIECFKKWIGYGVELGAQSMAVHLGGAKAVSDSEEKKRAKELNVKSLKELVGELKGTDMSLDLENDDVHGFILSVEEMIEIIEKVDSEKVKMCLDIPHMFTTHADLEQSIIKGKEYINIVHISDTKTYNDEHLLPGQGIIPWDRVMNAFNLNGFSGPFMYELDISKTASLNTEQKIDLLKKSKLFLEGIPIT